MPVLRPGYQRVLQTRRQNTSIPFTDCRRFSERVLLFRLFKCRRQLWPCSSVRPHHCYLLSRDWFVNILAVESYEPLFVFTLIFALTGKMLRHRNVSSATRFTVIYGQILFGKICSCTYTANQYEVSSFLFGGTPQRNAEL